MMKKPENIISIQIIEKAKEFGASLAGIASVEALKKSPSYLIYGKLNDYNTVGNKESNKIRLGEVAWPDNSKSAIIIAVEHPVEKPEMDWWKEGYSGGTPGNHILIFINSKLLEWLKKEKGIEANPLPYHIERGGIFLKDTAVMAGLGCIGKNNMLVTPEYGPRVRFRVILTAELLTCTDPIDFDPCEDCSMPCRNICPKKAFHKKIYSEEEFGLDHLPARTGLYSKYLCNEQMELDEKSYEEIKIENVDKQGKLVKYCRACELACPLGKTN